MNGIRAFRRGATGIFGGDQSYSEFADELTPDLIPVVEYHFSHRVYHLPFRTPVRTGHGLWSDRTGVWVRLEDEAGKIGFGEAAPIPWFGTETAEEIDAACRSLGDSVDDAMLDAVPAKLGCLKNALAAARAGEVASPPDLAARQVAALLPAGPAAIDAVQLKLEAGFRVFKWKVGVGETATELGLLDDLCAELPDGAKIRLDANGAWDRRTAERWLSRCAERPVEFIEQPCLAPLDGASQGAALRGKTDDLLRGLAEDYPTPLALDESIVRDGDVARWLSQGWAGFYVIKTALLADPGAVLRALDKASAKVVFSSALETAVGAKTALQHAFAWTGSKHALGFGVWPLFANRLLNGPTALPFVRWEDVNTLNPEAAWNALN